MYYCPSDYSASSVLSSQETKIILFQAFFERSSEALSADVGGDDDDEVSRRHISSLAPILDRFSRPPLSIESQVVHAGLNYKGYVDCITNYSDGNENK